MDFAREVRRPRPIGFELLSADVELLPPILVMVKAVGFKPDTELAGLPFIPSFDDGIFTTTGRTDAPPFCPNFLPLRFGARGDLVLGFGDETVLPLDPTLMIDGFNLVTEAGIALSR
jgi:hypothetical protein